MLCVTSTPHVIPRSCRNRSSTKGRKERKPCPTRSPAKSRAGCRRADGRSPSASAPSCSRRSCSSSTSIAIAHRVGGENAPTPVLVAKQLIPAGTPGTLVASQAHVRADDASAARKSRSGRSPIRQYLSGRAAAVDIFPGQQFTATDFAATDTASVDSQITGHAARALDLDRRRPRQLVAGHGRRLRRRLHRRSAGVVKLFRPNVKVLTIPTVPGPAGGGNLILQIETERRCQLRVRGRQHAALSSSSARSSAPSRPPSQANAATVLR